jgi:hypothetical protein
MAKLLWNAGVASEPARYHVLSGESCKADLTELAQVVLVYSC